MPVLVDGNNLLYAARALEEHGDQIGRSKLCAALAEWSRRTGHRVRIVFDGPAPPRSAAAQISGGEIEVVYSGGESADSVIARLIEEDSAARRVLVVSSDREVKRSAKRRRARSATSPEFWVGVRAELERRPPTRTEPREKRAGLDPEATEAWLKRFGFDA